MLEKNYTFGFSATPTSGGSPFKTKFAIDFQRRVFPDWSSPEILDLTLTDPALKGFVGGFTRGNYGYCVPYYIGGGVWSGKIARIDLTDFSTVSVLDLATINANFVGFHGGFVVGKYGYLVPYFKGGVGTLGDFIKIDLDTFTYVGSIDLSLTDIELRGFYGGFADALGNYGYCVPYLGNGAYSGKIARIDLNDFSTVSTLDLTLIDVSLKGFHGGHEYNGYGYFIPQYDGVALKSKIARVNLTDFATVTVLDLALTDPSLKGFVDAFVVDGWLYMAPYAFNDTDAKIIRVNLGNFSTVEILELSIYGPTYFGFGGCFTDGVFGYFVPYYNTAYVGRVVRVLLSDFDEFDVIDLESINPAYTGYQGGFNNNGYGYCVPFVGNLGYHGYLAKFKTEKP